MRGENTFVGLEKMRIGHRRDDVADDPEVAANGIVLREFFARQQTGGIGLHHLEDGDYHFLALELEMLNGRRGNHRDRQRQQQMTAPLPEQVSRRVARCIARARDGDGAEGKSAGGPMQETPHPQERASKARGTECGNLDGAAPSLLTGDVWHPADHRHHQCQKRQR